MLKLIKEIHKNHGAANLKEKKRMKHSKKAIVLHTESIPERIFVNLVCKFSVILERDFKKQKFNTL